MPVWENLEKLDLHRLLVHGMPEKMEAEIRSRAGEYLHAGLEIRNTTKALVTQRVSPVILVFARRMATVGMQKKESLLVDLGLAAVDLSRMMQIDHRDAFGIAGELAFAAHRCDVDIRARARTVILDISSQLLIALETPLASRVLEDNEGNLTFWSSWSKAHPTDAAKGHPVGIVQPERLIKIPPHRRRKTKGWLSLG